MPDLNLIQTRSGKWSFQVLDGDLVRTDQPWPAIQRLLLQGAWIGDDGERDGECLNDVTLSTNQTKERVTRIAQTRLGVLIRTSQITAVEVLGVTTDQDGVLVADISVTIPGAEPKTIQVPLTR